MHVRSKFVWDWEIIWNKNKILIICSLFKLLCFQEILFFLLLFSSDTLKESTNDESENFIPKVCSLTFFSKSWTNIQVTEYSSQAYISQSIWNGYLRHRRTAKTSLHMRAVLPEHLQITHTVRGTQKKFQTKSHNSGPVEWLCRFVWRVRNDTMLWSLFL